MNQLIYKSLLDIYPYPIIISKYDGEFLFVNTVYAKSMGFDNPENMIGLNMLNFNALDYNPNELLEILKNGGVIDNHEVSGIKKDTGEIWVALFSSRLVTYDGEDAILSTTIDMSAQKQLERAIKEEQEKLKITLNELIDEKTKYLTLFEEAGDAIVLLDTNGVFFDANQMACNLFKTTKNKFDEILKEIQIYLFSPSENKREKLNSNNSEDTELQSKLNHWLRVDHDHNNKCKKWYSTMQELIPSLQNRELRHN